jgi:hypothetical protein
VMELIVLFLWLGAGLVMLPVLLVVGVVAFLVVHPWLAAPVVLAIAYAARRRGFALLQILR